MLAAAGGMSEQAAELAAEERRVLSSIHDLLGSLQQEKQALLVSLSAHRASTYISRLLPPIVMLVSDAVTCLPLPAASPACLKASPLQEQCRALQSSNTELRGQHEALLRGQQPEKITQLNGTAASLISPTSQPSPGQVISAGRRLPKKRHS